MAHQGQILCLIYIPATFALKDVNKVIEADTGIIELIKNECNLIQYVIVMITFLTFEYIVRKQTEDHSAMLIGNHKFVSDIQS